MVLLESNSAISFFLGGNFTGTINDDVTFNFITEIMDAAIPILVLGLIPL